MVGAGHLCLELPGKSSPFLDSGWASTSLRVIYRQNMTNFGKRIDTNESGGKSATDQEGDLTDELSSSTKPCPSLCTPSIDQSCVSTLNFLTLTSLGQGF